MANQHYLSWAVTNWSTKVGTWVGCSLEDFSDVFPDRGNISEPVVAEKTTTHPLPGSPRDIHNIVVSFRPGKPVTAILTGENVDCVPRI